VHKELSREQILKRYQDTDPASLTPSNAITYKIYLLTKHQYLRTPTKCGNSDLHFYQITCMSLFD